MNFSCNGQKFQYPHIIKGKLHNLKFEFYKGNKQGNTFHQLKKIIQNYLANIWFICASKLYSDKQIPPLTSSNLHGLVNFRHSQPGLQILTIRTTDCIHFLLPTISSLLLFDNMPLHHENTLVCYGTLSACDCGGYHANSPGKKWYEKYTTLDNQKAASKKETSNQE